MKLSIFVVTYNQEKFIRQCLDSILMQTVNFDYEVIIGEDCSTDKTPDICDEYAARHSNIHVFHHLKNLGLVKNWEFVLNHCQGQYIAMIEGDDYWIDDYKLQRQVDWLDTHPEYVLTCTNVSVIYDDPDCIQEGILPIREEREYSREEILKEWIVLTSSVVFRNVIHQIHYPREIYVNDTYTFLQILKHGKSYLLGDTTTAYRRHNKNFTRTEIDIQSDINWAIQYMYFAKHLDTASLRRIASIREDEWLRCIIDAPVDYPGVLKCRIRYMMKHPELILSPFFIKTLRSYTFFRHLKFKPIAK